MICRPTLGVSSCSRSPVLPVCCLLRRLFSHPPPRAEPIRVMSFNIRYGTAKDGDNVWENRKDFVADYG